MAASRSVGWIGALLCGALASCANADIPPPAPPPAPPPPVEVVAVADEPASALSLLDHASWRAEGEHGWQRIYRFDGDRYTASGSPAWEESGRIVLVNRDGRRLEVRFTERMFDGGHDDPLDARLTLADDGASFDMNGETYRKLGHQAVIAAGEIAPAATSPEKP